MSVANELVKLGMPAVMADYLADMIATGGDDEVAARLTAVEEAVEALDGRVGTTEDDIEALDGRVGTAEDDIEALDGRVTTLETPASPSE